MSVFPFLSLFFLFYRGGLELQTQSQRSWWSSCISTKDMLFLILPLLLVCPASGMNFSTWEDQQKCIELENVVGDLCMRALGPQGHQQPLMALTGIFVLFPAFSLQPLTSCCIVCHGAWKDCIFSYIRYLYIMQFPNHVQSCSFACNLWSMFPLAHFCSLIPIWVVLSLLSLV